MDIFSIGKRLPSRLDTLMARSGTGALMDFPDRLFLMQMDDFNPDDLKSFKGPGRFRIYRGQTCLLISLSFSRFSFDFIWSPVQAKMSGEEMFSWENGEHALMNLILIDGRRRIRGMRSATISPAAGAAVRRAQDEIMPLALTERDVLLEMNALFLLHPKGFEDGLFHEVSSFGD